VNDVAILAQITLGVTVLAAPAALLARLLAGPDPAPTNLFRLGVDPPWPRGIQEEDPPRWRVEILDRRGPASGDHPEPLAQGGRSVDGRLRPEPLG
jgi:hypothetical protein